MTKSMFEMHWKWKVFLQIIWRVLGIHSLFRISSSRTMQTFNSYNDTKVQFTVCLYQISSVQWVFYHLFLSFRHLFSDKTKLVLAQQVFFEICFVQNLIETLPIIQIILTFLCIMSFCQLWFKRVAYFQSTFRYFHWFDAFTVNGYS